MSQRFRIGADLPRNLVERGIAIPAVLQHAQLPLGLFEQERAWVTTDIRGRSPRRWPVPAGTRSSLARRRW
jgi:hypothetical protein